MANIEQEMEKITRTINMERDMFMDKLRGLDKQKINSIKELDLKAKKELQNAAAWGRFTLPNLNQSMDDIIKQIRAKNLDKIASVNRIIKTYEKEVTKINKAYKKVREKHEKNARREIDRLEKEADQLTKRMAKA